MAITGNPGDLATGGFGTGVRGVAATPSNVAAAVSRGNAMAAARDTGGNGPAGTGFRGPATTWGSSQSVVPGSALAGQLASPLGIYNGALNVTQDQLVKAATTGAPIFGGTVQNPSLMMLKEMASQVKASPQLQGILGGIYGPFMSGGAPTQVPSGLLGSALNAALPSATSQPSTTQTQDKGQFANSELGSQLASIKFGENIPAPVSPAITGEGWVDIEPGVNVNSPEVQDLIAMAKATSAQTGRRLTITSGVAPRAAGSLQHPAGVAIDLKAYSPVTGKELANYQSPQTFSDYERIAQTMRAVQQQNFPQYNDTFRWGGYFSGVPGTYGALDLMHFDVNNPKGYGMAGGSFEAGLTPEMRQAWGITDPTATMVQKPITVATGPSPAPTLPAVPIATAPVQAVMPQTMVAAETLPPRYSPPGLLSGAAKAAEYGTQLLASSQPQVVNPVSAAPAAPAPIQKPIGEPISLASLLFETARERRGEGGRRRQRRSTTTEQTMNDSIGGILA